MNKRMMIGAAMLAALMASPAFAQQAGFGNALGNWSRDDGNAKVRLAPCGKSLCATNTWIGDPASSEKVGDKLVMDLKPSGSGAWKGSAYDPQRKLTYAMLMSMAGGKLQTRGCIVGGLLCKTVSWTRMR